MWSAACLWEFSPGSILNVKHAVQALKAWRTLSSFVTSFLTRTKGISKSKRHAGKLFTHFVRVSKHFFFFCSVRDRCSFSRGSHSTPASVIMAGSITHLLSRCLRLLFLLLWCQKSFCVNCYYSFRVSFTAECDTVCLMRRYFCVAVFFFTQYKRIFFRRSVIDS